MKRSFTLQPVIAVCLFGLVMSCHKRGEFEVPCKLMRMSYVERGALPFPSEEYTGYLTHNSWGDPEKIIWDVTATGRPNYYFHYDKKKRLTRFDAVYSPTNVDYVKTYFVEGDRIAGDTTWYWASDINNFRGTAFTYGVNTYTYDSKGRITRVDTKTKEGNVYSMTDEYDANGNKILTGTYQYDNKKSFLRTNAWLMFVARNFSVNNPQVADAYNKKGLPLTYENSVITFINSFVNEFDYSCDHKNH